MQHLEARTVEGRQAVELAHTHESVLVARAARHDAESAYVASNIDELRESGLLNMCVPQRYGGLGVTSVHDTAVVMSRLGRWCASTALSANMIVTQMLYRSVMLQRAEVADDQAGVDRWQEAISALDEAGLVVVASATEPGSAWGVPFTTALPDGDGYRVTGQKVFATNAEIGDVFTVDVRVADEDGRWQLGEVTLLPGMPGFVVGDDWDGLGMRGTGSHSLQMDGCLVPAGNVRLLGPVHAPGLADLEMHSFINFPLVGVYLGLAESSREQLNVVLTAPLKRPFVGETRDRPQVQREVAEIAVDLFSSRAAVGRAGQLLDEHLLGEEPCSEAAMQHLFMEWQCAKLVVNQCATRVVRRAMTLLGGRGYLASSPLARIYRDVLAGSFMQPFNVVDGYSYIGEVACGISPLRDLREAMDAYARGATRGPPSAGTRARGRPC